MKPLADNFGRVHDYLRLSLIDKCNLRCVYCMPENIKFMPKDQLLTADELVAITRYFVEHYGVKKVRLTGGEPLVRYDFAAIVRRIAELGVKQTITTNGILLNHHLDLFKEVGLEGLNISLDTLNSARFLTLTRRDEFDIVLQNINLAIEQGFFVKVNVVVMRGQNVDEINDFIAWTKDVPVHVRFIEFMPFDGNQWEWDNVLSYKEIMEVIGREFEFSRTVDGPNSTSKGYQVPGHAGSFAVISSVTDHFCGSCNRLRLTAEGKLRNCLFGKEELDLREALRNGQELSEVIETAVAMKQAKCGGLPDFQNQEAVLAKLSSRAMVKIGG